MDGKIKISIDVMGGENSPDKTLEGISLFVKRYQNKDDYFFYLFGDVDQINKKIKKFSNLKSNYKIIDTKIVVADDLSALSAIKKGKNSSMWECINSHSDISCFTFKNYYYPI